MRRPLRTVSALLSLAGGAALLASCGSPGWVSAEDATLVTAPPDPSAQGRPDSAWGGELALREDCVVVVSDPNPVRIAVLPPGWSVVHHAETSEYAVQSDEGKIFPLDTEYQGGGVALESPEELARYPEVEGCTDKLGIELGTRIFTVEPAGPRPTSAATQDGTGLTLSPATTEPTAPPTATGTSASEAQMRPDLLEVSPSPARPGQILEVRFPEETERGLAWVLEEREGDTWQLRYYLSSAPGGYDSERTPSWWSVDDREGKGWQAPAFAGPGPDLLVVPDTATPGEYRLCTFNSPPDICTPLDITD